MFSARKKAKKAVSVDHHVNDDGEQREDTTSEPVVKRPALGSKTKSKLRMTFDPEADDAQTSDLSESTSVIKPQRLGASLLSRTGTPVGRDETRPSYSKTYLDELKGSTPSTPKDLSVYNSSAEEDLPAAAKALDIASKFGSSKYPGPSAAIPSASEIAEKKARRVRLALAQETAGSNSVKNNDDYVSLDAYDSDGEFKPSRLQVSNYLRDDKLDNAQEYTRLVPEDEDVAEGFDNFVDDDADHPSRAKGRILMGMKSDVDADRRAMREMIDAAEGGSSSDGASDSDASAKQNYVTAQTAHGTAFSNLTKQQRRRIDRDAQRPKQPDKTTSIPTLSAGLARLRELQNQAVLNQQRAETRKGQIRHRLGEIDDEKGRIQSALEDLGRQLEQAERNVMAEREGNTNGPELRTGGLDDLGTTIPERGHHDSSSS